MLFSSSLSTDAPVWASVTFKNQTTAVDVYYTFSLIIVIIIGNTPLYVYRMANGDAAHVQNANKDNDHLRFLTISALSAHVRGPKIIRIFYRLFLLLFV